MGHGIGLTWWSIRQKAGGGGGGGGDGDNFVIMHSCNTA